MTREEQIYEIADIIRPDWCNGKDCRKCYANTHYENCQYIDRAKRLYDKGYRNQTDLLKEFVEWLKNKFPKGDYDVVSVDIDRICDELKEFLKERENG